MTRILIIEDEIIIRKELRRLLSRHGYQVEEAGSIREALADHPPHQFELVLADLRLPGALGTDIIGPSQTTPVVIMTSYASVKSAVEAMKLGAKDYITKPFDHEELLSVIQRSLPKRVDGAGATQEKASGLAVQAAAAAADGVTADGVTAAVVTAAVVTAAVGVSSRPSREGTSAVASPGPSASEPKTSEPKTGPKSEASAGAGLAGMVGESMVMREVFSRIQKVAPTVGTVLVLGESGTGKELVARAIHRLSARSHGPLVAINCAAIPEGLIESELFGTEKGAFTGANMARPGVIEAAHQGTLFLDELGELPLSAQARLLRVLQEAEVRRLGGVQARKVDVRLIGATHRNLKQLVREGRFREDLYFRLNVLEIHLPPLRERGDDMLLLARAFVHEACARHRKPSRSLLPETEQAIRTHLWPGNVRELANTVERAVILYDEPSLTPQHLGLEPEPSRAGDARADARATLQAGTQAGTQAGAQAGTQAGAQAGGRELPADTDSDETGEGTLPLSLEAYFRQFVLEHQERLTETELARQLGISRKALWERRQRFNLPRPVKR